MPIQLAIGFRSDDDSDGTYTWSIGIRDDLSSPQRVARKLVRSSGGTVPEEILIVQNGNRGDGPAVIRHWVLDKDYTAKRHSRTP
jgi:hypothetical protein